MLDWNVVVTVHDGAFRRACVLLDSFGILKRTDYYNVLVMKVDDVEGFLDRLKSLSGNVPKVLNIVSRVMPASTAFDFQTAEAFEAKAREVALSWAPRLANGSFHVRIHRRGFKGRLSSQDEERFLDGALLAALEAAGTPGRITFDDPDAIIDVEIVGQRAGMSLWTREELERYPFLKLD